MNMCIYHIKCDIGIFCYVSLKEVWNLNLRQYGQMEKAQAGRNSDMAKVRREKTRDGEAQKMEKVRREKMQMREKVRKS